MKWLPLRGESFCLPSACRDAPLGQRQGGVFRLPPPYLWTPPTPQRAKGCSPLTIPKKKSKHKKASAAPVGAIALTLFSLLHLKPLSRCATAPPRGSLWVLPETLSLPLKAVPLRDDFPRSGGRCRVATKGGVWLDAKRQDGRGNHRHTAFCESAALRRGFLCALCPKRREIFLSPCVNGGYFASNRACRGRAASDILMVWKKATPRYNKEWRLIL